MNESTKMNVALKWGCIMGIMLTIMSLAFYLSGATDPSTGKGGVLSTVLSYIVSIGAIVMGIQAYKKEHNNNLSLGDAVVLGMLVGIVGGVVMAIYTYIFFTFLDPSMMEIIKEQSLANAGDLDPDAEEKVAGIMNFVTSVPFISFMVIIMKFFLGLFTGLFAGLVMKEENLNYPDLLS